ncbi:MAG: hypothetical protein HOJ45_20095, partial [Gemmatimonadetes bacterium]|nr:hypothetical protein [Gemmatimonadota bacterium]
TMELLHTIEMPSSVTSFKWSPTGPFLLSGHEDQTVRLAKVTLLEQFCQQRGSLPLGPSRQ